MAVPEHSQLEGHMQPALQDPTLCFLGLPCGQSKSVSLFITILLLVVAFSGKRKKMEGHGNVDQ